jgi:hypothetical protein
MANYKFQVGDLVRVEYIEKNEWTKYLNKLCRIVNLYELALNNEINYYQVTGKAGMAYYFEKRLTLIKRDK